jgi:hypothetical protein
MFQAEPIRVLPQSLSFDMDIDAPTTIPSPQKKRGLERMKQAESTRKRLRANDGTYCPDATIVSNHTSTSADHNDASSQLQALSIDLIVSHIIGYLPWKQQIVSCARVSKLWNQAFLTAPMRVLLLPTTNSKNQTFIPRVLEPCRMERCLNEMRWKIFGQMADGNILNKVTRLDIWGDLDSHKEVTKHFTKLGHVEELYLRYMSIDTLLGIFPESKHPRFGKLTKLVIQEWRTRNHEQNDSARIEENRALLRQRILFHAPNLLILKA